MFRPAPLFVALRYLRARRRNRFQTFVALTSLGGIALGVAAMVVVLSVINGFEREVTRHILGMSAHGIMVPARGDMTSWRALAAAAREHPGVVGITPYVRGSGMVSRRGEMRGIVIEGVDPDTEIAVTDLERYLSPAALEVLRSDDDAVLLGRLLAERLGVGVGDRINLLLPDFGRGARRTPRFRQLEVAGVFHVGMHQFDARFVMMNLAATQRLLELGDAVSGLRVRFNDAQSAPFGMRTLAGALDRELRVLDWTQYHRNFFLALESQKRILFVVLVLIVAVAAFNIAANMIMVVTEKVRDIAILRTLGMTRARIMALFLLQGSMIGVAGALIGGLLGALGASYSERVAGLVERWLDVDLINAEVYFIDYLPAALEPVDLLAVAGSSIALALLATLYPAWRAASLDPALGVHRD